MDIFFISICFSRILILSITVKFGSIAYFFMCFILEKLIVTLLFNAVKFMNLLV